jgi:hypothetical protein
VLELKPFTIVTHAPPGTAPKAMALEGKFVQGEDVVHLTFVSFAETGCTTLEISLDDQPLQTGAVDITPRLEDDRYREELVVTLPLPAVRRLGDAKLFRWRHCRDEYVVTGSQLDENGQIARIHRFASQLGDGPKGAF